MCDDNYRDDTIEMKGIQDSDNPDNPNSRDLKEKMRDFFDGLAENWHTGEGDFEVRERCVSEAGLSEGGVVADIGSGRGVMFPHILKANPRELISVEISPQMVALAKREHADPRIRYMCSDILEADLPMLDAAFIYNAYPHLLDRVALAAKLGECIRPGGVLLIAHSNSKDGVNAMHGSEAMAELSRILEDCEAEAQAFAGFFDLASHSDGEGGYFIKLVRKGEMPEKPEEWNGGLQ